MKRLSESTKNNVDNEQGFTKLKSHCYDNLYLDAQYNLAFYYDGKNNMEKAFELYTAGANQGHPDSQRRLARCYKCGRGVKKDIKKAVHLFTLAVNQGDPDSQRELALCYKDGTGVKPSMKKAIELYTLAANQGHAQSQRDLALCYKYGKGVKMNVDKAIELYTLAENQYIDTEHKLYLAKNYLEGIGGVEKNEEKAIEIFTSLAKRGIISAQEKLALCYSSKNMEIALTWCIRSSFDIKFCASELIPMVELIIRQKAEIELLKTRVTELEITVPIEGGPLYQEAKTRFDEFKKTKTKI